MWRSDKNNINIGPNVRLKKMRCFHFFPEIRYHSAKWFSYYNEEPFGIPILLFRCQDETWELPYHNKQAWLHHVRLNFTSQLSRVWRGRVTMMLRSKILKSTNQYEVIIFKQTDYRQTLSAKWRRKRNDLQNLCWILRGYVKFTALE